MPRVSFQFDCMGGRSADLVGGPAMTRMPVLEMEQDRPSAGHDNSG